MAFVFSIVVFFIDHYPAGGEEGGGGNLISIAYFSFHLAYCTFILNGAVQN